MRDEVRVAGCRSVFISDLHLGSFRSDAASLLDFLNQLTTETLYLVGDIVDFWSLRRRTAWRAEPLLVVRRIIEMSRSGTRIVLVPGNHDSHLLDVAMLGLTGVEVLPRLVVDTLAGERLLVVHGHENDPVYGSSSDLAGVLFSLGERACERLARLRGGPGRSEPERVSLLSQPSRFERRWIEAVRELGVDGVICGHSHRPADLRVNGVRYLNCGDWLQNRTVVVEDWSGALQLCRWHRVGESVGVGHREDVLSAGEPVLWSLP